MTDVPTLSVQLLRPAARPPVRATPGSSGFDLYACPDDGLPLVVSSDPVRVPTGIAIESPPGFDLQIRPRSGLAASGVIATFGTLDADYRGEVFVTMYTVGTRAPYVVQPGDRIAQLVVARLIPVEWELVASLGTSARGAGGHGSTGR